MKKIFGIMLAAILVAGTWLHQTGQLAFTAAPYPQERLPPRLAGNRQLSADLRPSGSARAAGGEPRNRQQILAGLERNSAGHWQVAWTGGFVSRMYGASLPGSGSASEAGKAFLAKYGELIGLTADQAVLEQVRSIDGNTQVLYSQQINGLPVFGSRINLIFDVDNNLIYLSAFGFGASVPPASPVSARLAARVALGGLGEYSRRHLLPEPQISLADMQARGRLGYRLVGSTIGLVYMYTIAQPRSPLDLRIFVDAARGELSDIRDLLKNK